MNNVLKPNSWIICLQKGNLKSNSKQHLLLPKSMSCSNSKCLCEDRVFAVLREEVTCTCWYLLHIGWLTKTRSLVLFGPWGWGTKHQMKYTHWFCEYKEHLYLWPIPKFYTWKVQSLTCTETGRLAGLLALNPAQVLVLLL